MKKKIKKKENKKVGVTLVKTQKGAKVGFYDERRAWNEMAGDSIH